MSAEAPVGGADEERARARGSLLAAQLAMLRERLHAARDEWARDACWRAMEQGIEHAGEAMDVELAGAVLRQDADALDAVLAGWADGSREPCGADRQILRHALRAVAERMLADRLDELEPPSGFEPEVWNLLVSRGRLAWTEAGRLRFPGRADRS